MSHQVGIVSLGCPRNLVDSETMLERLKEKGFAIGELSGAQIVIVNTCAFIKEAKEESIHTILDLVDVKRQGLIKKIIVAGCLVERYKDELQKQFKNDVDAFIGRIQLNGSVTHDRLLTFQHSAYLKISEGCANVCSYCVIPQIKGKLASRSEESILKQVALFDAAGVKEINLIGQDITMYGAETGRGPQLLSLLKQIVSVAKYIPWIRLLYLHPSRVDDALLDFIAAEKRICRYIDLPLQHCNDRILTLMNRKVSKADIVRLIKKIRKKIPGVFLRTSMIVGFPGETEKEFQELVDFIKEIKFERLGAFTYSREEGTRAYHFKHQIHPKTKERRQKELMLAQQKIATELNRTLLHTKQTVLVDAVDDDDKNLYLARLEQDAPEVDGTVYVRSAKPLAIGEFYAVRITDTWEYDLVGEILPKSKEASCKKDQVK